MKKELKIFTTLTSIFLVAYFLPLGSPQVSKAILEAFNLLQWYARNHTLACVVPAMFIAGAISTFLSHGSVLRYLGPRANRTLAYGVGAVAGFILAVCSCSVLPMFAGIYTLGAGLGPASAFLYSGPAINVMALFLTPRVLGIDLGIARAIGAVTFAIVIGLLMAFIFRREEVSRNHAAMQLPDPPPSPRSLWQTTLFFVCLVLFLVFSDWYSTNDVTIRLKDGTQITANVKYQTRDTLDIQAYEPDGHLSTEVRRLRFDELTSIEPVPSWTTTIHGNRWYLAGLMGLAVLFMVWRWFEREEVKQWMTATWDFGKQIVPLLFGGVFITGFVGELIPERYVATLVGGNSLLSNFAASFIGMIWYFATLTEIPIVEVLTRMGMGRGPALSLLLAGPALSLPSILVLISIMGPKKTFVFSALTVVMSTTVGWIFGMVA